MHHNESQVHTYSNILIGLIFQKERFRAQYSNLSNTNKLALLDSLFRDITVGPMYVLYVCLRVFLLRRSQSQLAVNSVRLCVSVCVSVLLTLIGWNDILWPLIGRNTNMILLNTTKLK